MRIKKEVNRKMTEKRLRRSDKGDKRKREDQEETNKMREKIKRKRNYNGGKRKREDQE